MWADRLNRALVLGLRFLAASQRRSGEFPTYWSRTPSMDNPTEVSSPFVTGMVLLALRSINRAEQMQERGLGYLHSCRRPDGTFAFFATGIDPDVDDTCLLNWLLLRREGQGFPHRALAARIAGLQRQDGLFPTWIRERKAGLNPTDSCVNLNVLRYLDACGAPCSGLVHALHSAFARRPFRGTFYYRPDFSFAYLASTLFPPLRRAVLGNGNSPEGGGDRYSRWPADSLETALRLVYVAQNRGGPALAVRLAGELLLLQQRAGGWPASAMFRAFNYWGSPELTTAIALQALADFERVIPCAA